MGMLIIDDLKPGMVLAGDVKDRNGRNLLAAGTELSEKHLRVFRIWGIVEVNVKGVEHESAVAEAAAQIDPEALRHAEEIVAELFRCTDPEEAVTRELRRATTLRIARKGKGGGDGR